MNLNPQSIILHLVQLIGFTDYFVFSYNFRAASKGVPITAHAGEWPTEDGLNTLENVHFAWKELNARRIGHGIALRADADLEKTVQEMRRQSDNTGNKNLVSIEVT